VEDAQEAMNRLAEILGLTLSEEVHLDAQPFRELAAAHGIHVEQHPLQVSNPAIPGRVLAYILVKPPPQASDYIDLLIEKRSELRKAKQWALADKIRTGLAKLNVTLEDTAKGTIWRVKR
jgi:cysteinyl-tRNA synthetase